MMILPATPATIASLAPALAELPLLKAYGHNVTTLLQSLGRALSRGDQLRVAVDDNGTALGMSWFLPRGAFGTGAYLRLLAMAPAHAGAGVGAQLLKDFEEQSDTPPGGWFAWVSEPNKRALSFYERHGYRHVGTLPGFVQPEKIELLLHKPQK